MSGGDPSREAQAQAAEPATAQVTQMLRDWNAGSGAGTVVSALYSELHRMAERALHSERGSHTLQPTALISELYLRLDASHPPEWKDRRHFFAVASNTLRRILIDYARAHAAERRGGNGVRVPLGDSDHPATCSLHDLLAIDEALTALEQVDARAARVTELRFFGGLPESEIALELGVAEITVKRDWKFARAWLAAHLTA